MNTLTRFAVLAILAGCSTTPHYDKHFGDAVRQAKLAMTINPNASANPDPATGIDGQAATEAIARYQGSFKAPPPVVNVINIGGVAGAAK
jgi:predicted component of type VI protein secretion system